MMSDEEIEWEELQELKEFLKNKRIEFIKGEQESFQKAMEVSSNYFQPKSKTSASTSIMKSLL